MSSDPWATSHHIQVTADGSELSRRAGDIDVRHDSYHGDDSCARTRTRDSRCRKSRSQGNARLARCTASANVVGATRIRLLAARAARIPIAGSKPRCTAASDQWAVGVTVLTTQSDTYSRPATRSRPTFHGSTCRRCRRRSIVESPWVRSVGSLGHAIETAADVMAVCKRSVDEMLHSRGARCPVEQPATRAHCLCRRSSSTMAPGESPLRADLSR